MTAASTQALTDPDLVVGLAGGAPWWQARMARFTDGPDHAGRREAVQGLLAGLAPDDLAAAARARTEAWLAVRTSRADGMVVARRVPVAVLAAALGVPGERVDEGVNRTAVVVAAVAPRCGPAPFGPAATDAALRTLRTHLPAADEDGTIAALSILFQTHDATAALIGNALVAWASGAAPEPAALVAGALRDDPPVLSTRRVGPDGPVAVDLAGLPFGAGPHACPGRDLAVALATGVLAGIRVARWTPRPGAVTYEARPNLRLPERVDLRPLSPGGGPPPLRRGRRSPRPSRRPPGP